MIKRINSLNGSGNIFYVGGSGSGNYSNIQNAIDNATINDTVFVYDDSSPYIENIIIEKSINLIGEDKNTTVIDGSNIGDVVFISANFVNITGFSIKNSGNVNRDAGIKIQSEKNRIIGNNIQNNDDGIGFISASYNIITNNRISNNDYGIRIFISSKIFIFDNNIYSNKFRGMRFESSNSNIISNNQVSNNGNGILFEESDKNNFSGNIVSNNGIGLDIVASINLTIEGNEFINDGLKVEYSYKNSISNNNVNGRPLVYLEEKSDMIIKYNTGQIILVKCNNITIKYQEIYNVTSGILLWQTNNSFISYNELYSNDLDGILLHSSNNNIIYGNTISKSENGISLEYSSNNNHIYENKIFQNAYGIHLIYSSGFTNISDNTIINNTYGIQLFDSHDITVTNNWVQYNYFGISLWEYSSNNFVFGNGLIFCDTGIWLNTVNDNRIIKNVIIASNSYGIWLLESIHNKVQNNSVWLSSCSVGLFYSNFNIILENSFIEGGILISFSYHNTVKDNTVNEKKIVYLEDETDIIVEEAGQVILINCERIIVRNNHFSDLIAGVQLENAGNCQIINNTFFNNSYNSVLLYSDNNSFSKNVISNYDHFGLYLLYSNDNLFSENSVFLNVNKKDEISLNYDNLYPIIINDFDQNSKAVLIQNSNRNTLLNNNISDNNNGIVLEFSCNENIIQENNIQSNKKTGILIFDSCENNFIFKNKIEKNGEFGIYLEESSYNKIKKNTFLDNNISAYFEHSFFNRWIKNYWDLPRIFPKTISGNIKIGSRLIRWINIDWRPTKIPFLIWTCINSQREKRAESHNERLTVEEP